METTIRWKGETSLVDEAAAWLRAELAAGPVAVRELQRRAADAGIAPRTLRRAKESLRLRVGKGRSQDAPWYWSLSGNERGR